MISRTLLNGDCLEKLKELYDESIDLLCTDPPYGYGFMNKDWDKAVVKTEVWKECLRVLKPGSFAFVMSAPRQDVMSHMIVNLDKAGFKTDFTPMFWAYASGFPKAMNISKMVDKKLGFEPTKISEKSYSSPDFSEEQFTKQGSMMQTSETSERIQCYNTKPTSPEAKKLDGSYAGFQPKPAVEVILVCMKPLSEKNYTDQAMKNGKGITWLDDCRIPTNEVFSVRNDFSQRVTTITNNQTPDFYSNEKGRFPANLIVSDNSLDMGKKTKSQHTKSIGGFGVACNTFGLDDDKHTVDYKRGFDDSGDFSRYFSLDQWEAQFVITPKPSKSEKNKGLDKYLINQDKYGGKFLTTGKLSPSKVNDGRKTEIDNPFQRGETVRQNIHPTVKPISLFRYLVTLGSRTGDFILDPFMGSGTTAIACETLARNWIGIELNPQYYEIIKARISDYEKQEKLF